MPLYFGMVVLGDCWWDRCEMSSKKEDLCAKNGTNSGQTKNDVLDSSG